jgi:hypothetical protein
MESGTVESANNGLDVLWWSDHDGFFTHYHLVSSFSFESWQEMAQTNEPWVANNTSELLRMKSFSFSSAAGMNFYEGVISPDQAHQGTNSLRISGTSTSAVFNQVYYQFDSDNNRNKWAFASDLILEISVLPDLVSPDARPAVRVQLSVHSPTPPETAWPQYELRYYLDNDTLAFPSREGNIYSIPLRYNPSEWNTYTLRLTDDAVTGFSYLIGMDNSLFKLFLGVESRNGQEGSAYFDDLRITGAVKGDPLYARQKQLIDSMSQSTPDVTQLQGIEISEWIHLNEIGSSIVLPDYDSIAIHGGYMDQNGWIQDVTGFKAYAASYVVQQAHQRGNVVSFNHMFGASVQSSGGPDPQTTLAELLANDLYGADILEAGYAARGGQPLSSHLWVWDELAKAGVYLVGTGVGDSHGLAPGEWVQRINHMISWIYAEGPTAPALVDGLKRGRVFFGDLTEFDGSVDLLTDNGFSMGQIVVTDRLDAVATIFITGLEAGDQVRCIWNGQWTATYTATSDTFTQEVTHSIDGLNGVFLRIELYDPAGNEKAFSNPIYFVRSVPARGLDAFRGGIDLGGTISVSMENVNLTDASYSTQPEQSVLILAGGGNDGTIVLDRTNEPGRDSVHFTGMTGEWIVQDSILTLSHLSGTGTIEVFSIIGIPPVVSGIADQVIPLGGAFQPVPLDSIVTDGDDPDSLLTWSFGTLSHLNVALDTHRVAYVTSLDSLWTGAENVVFTVTDADGLSDSDTAVFTITVAPGTPIVGPIADQAVRQGEPFASISLDSVAHDPDTPDSVLVWSYGGATEIAVSIDSHRIATLNVINPAWLGTDTIWFSATDTGGLTGTDTALFTVNSALVPPVLTAIPDQRIQQGGTFAQIVLDEFVEDPDDPDSALAWTFGGGSAILVALDSQRVATLTIADSQWIGTDSIWFEAQDSNGLTGRDTVFFTVAPAGYKKYVNAGGPDYTDAAGQVYLADRIYSAGGFGYAGGAAKSTTKAINGTVDDPLFQTYRQGSFDYKFDGLPAGNYDVTLSFEEPKATTVGGRVFDISAEGVVVVDDLDIHLSAPGRFNAHERIVRVTVNDGQLNLVFTKGATTLAPLVCAIAVEAVPLPQTVPDIQFNPDTLDFLSVIVGDTASATASIANTGGVPMDVNAISLAAPQFFWSGLSLPFTVQPEGDAQNITVAFAPDSAGTYWAHLIVHSNDPDGLLHPLVLRGEGVTEYPVFAPVRINAGGLADFMDSQGQLFLADREYFPGGSGYTAGSAKSTAGSIAGTVDDPLYQTYRSAAQFAYLFDGIPAGTYQVTLYFQEPKTGVLGQRIFDVVAEGVVMIDNLDIYAQVGSLTAYTRTVNVPVSDSQLNVSFVQVVGPGFPVVSAISVAPVLARRPDTDPGESSSPVAYDLHQNYPNPFNPGTTIRYALKENGRATLKIYDILGRDVVTLLDDFQYAGNWSAYWDGKDGSGNPVATGIYFVWLRAGEYVKAQKMLLLK